MLAERDWLLGECAEDSVEVDTLIEPAALDLMAMRLSTPGLAARTHRAKVGFGRSAMVAAPGSGRAAGW